MNKNNIPSAEEILYAKLGFPKGSVTPYGKEIYSKCVEAMQEYAELYASHREALLSTSKIDKIINELEWLRVELVKARHHELEERVYKAIMALHELADESSHREPLKGMPTDEELSAWNEHSSPHSQDYCCGYEEGTIWLRDTYLSPALKENEELRERVKEAANIINDCNLYMGANLVNNEIENWMNWYQQQKPDNYLEKTKAP